MLAEEHVRKAHDLSVELGDNRAGPRVRDDEPLASQRQQVPGDVIVEEGVGEGTTVVPLPAVSVQRGNGRRIVRASRPEPQPG